MIDTVLHYGKRILFLGIGAVLLWQGLIHAADIANFFVLVINAVETFVLTIVHGIFR